MHGPPRLALHKVRRQRSCLHSQRQWKRRPFAANGKPSVAALPPPLPRTTASLAVAGLSVPGEAEAAAELPAEAALLPTASRQWLSRASRPSRRPPTTNASLVEAVEAAAEAGPGLSLPPRP